jgi:hypothetical protein
LRRTRILAFVILSIAVAILYVTVSREMKVLTIDPPLSRGLDQQAMPALSKTEAGKGQDTEHQMWRAGDPTYVPFKIIEMSASADSRFVGLTVDERGDTDRPVTSGQLSIYVLDVKTGANRKMGDGDSLLLPISGQEFLFYDSAESPILILDGLQTARSFDIGRHDKGWWNRKSAIFATAWPGDREGFNAIALLNTVTGDIVNVTLNQPTELLTVCPATGKFYTESFAANSAVGVDEYDLTGAFVRHLMSTLAVHSANCRYVLPFAALSPHGPDDWAAFESSSGSKLMDFPWSDDENVKSQLFAAWNPRYDNLLLVHSRHRGDTWSTDVIDLEQRTTVKSWAGEVPVIWSGDGTATITVREHHIVFEQLPIDVLKD